ncbi:MAG: hypothetical protein NTY80_03110 [candidate division SR1 bacterium]|nr:hypothetical protein [candidate division SR1 bacterium]
MKNTILLLVAVMIFTACNNNHHRKDDMQKEITNVPTQTPTVKVDSIMPTTVYDSSMDEKLYAEIFNKKALKFSSWKDSTITIFQGEGTIGITLSARIQHGQTKNFLFVIIATNIYYEGDEEDNGNEVRKCDIKFKPRALPITGKTLAEDKANQQLVEYQYLNYGLTNNIMDNLPEVVYPKRHIVKPED